MAIPTEELQKANPSAKIELFEIHLDSALHGSTDVSRFHNGINMNTTFNVVFQGNTYTRIPIEANGFEYSIARKTRPRPTIRISNLLSQVSALMVQANLTTPKNDLNGAKFKRIVTLLKFIDNANFESGVNPFGTPANNTYENQTFFIDRKTIESKDFVEFECVSALDLQNRSAPKRIITRKEFPSVGTFA
tara:strand:- start:79 stop:651 length:573 start_codon:yes stop_codon:yes gene_type:complete